MSDITRNYVDVRDATFYGSSNTQIRNELGDISAACKRIVVLLDRVTNEALPQDGSSQMHDALAEAFNVFKGEIFLAVEGEILPVVAAWEDYAKHIETADMKE